MPRQSISFTSINNEWLISQVESGEYSNKSEAINALIRNERKHYDELTIIRAALIKGELSGFSNETTTQIMQRVIAQKQKNGSLQTNNGSN